MMNVGGGGGKGAYHTHTGCLSAEELSVQHVTCVWFTAALLEGLRVITERNVIEMMTGWRRLVYNM